ncbi:septum formation family protein [Isoptericola sp. S6320L]|uniref:septum formation family protein n=1 Tax=Isoptericola sp. S6320L TaxID=2926411 RepID=UPI001FF6CD82|nr:septum formation family protein [Isoptericola sp. S6320L]MCK0117659.1 septum formation family protein [Isoptericola sp. S6320L]
MTDVPDRSEDPLFVSPGPGAAGPAGSVEPAGPAGPAVPGHPGADGGTPVDRPVPAGGLATPEDPTAYGARWGAPGGPTPAARAAARRRARGWVLSVLGVVVLVVVAAAGGSWLVNRAHDRAWEPVAGDVAEPGTVNAVQLVLGSCLADVPDSATVGTVEVVPCRDAHVAQVVGRHDSTVDEVWPGADVVQARAARACTPELVGARAEASGLADDLTWVLWTPSEESWEAGDRAGLCVTVSAAPRTGTLLE